MHRSLRLVAVVKIIDAVSLLSYITAGRFIPQATHNTRGALVGHRKFICNF